MTCIKNDAKKTQKGTLTPQLVSRQCEKSMAEKACRKGPEHSGGEPPEIGSCLWVNNMQQFGGYGRDDDNGCHL